MEEEICSKDPHHQVASLSSCDPVNAVARLKEDLIIEPHTYKTHAVGMWVDAPLSKLNAGVIFKASPLVACDRDVHEMVPEENDPFGDLDAPAAEEEGSLPP